MSHKFKAAETRYGICEKETLAIVYSLRQWEKFIIQSPQIVIETDNAAAAAKILTQRELPRGRKEAGYLEVLSRFRSDQLIIKHLLGIRNHVADPLSRLPSDVEQSPDMQSSDVLTHHLLALHEMPEDSSTPQLDHLRDTIIDAYDSDVWTKALLEYVEHPPTGSLSKCLRLCSKVDPDSCFLEKGLLRGVYQEHVVTILPVCPQTDAIRMLIIDNFHTMCIHGAHEETKKRLKANFFWKTCLHECFLHVSRCHVCQCAKDSNQPLYTNAQALPIPPYPFHTVHMDTCSGSPTVEYRGSGLLESVDCFVVFVDTLTKFVIIVPTSKKGLTGEKMAQIYYDNVFRRFGAATRFISDRGHEFLNEFSTRLNACFNTQLSRTSSYCPSTNGQVERYNRSILNKLRCMMTPTSDQETVIRDNWATYIPLLEFTLNSNTHAGTKFSPFFMNHGREMYFPTDFDKSLLLDPSNQSVTSRLQNIQTARLDAQEFLDSYQTKKITSAQRRFKRHNFQPGDKVLLNVKYLHLGAAHRIPKLIPRFIGPFTIQKMLSENTALIFWTDLCEPTVGNSKIDVELLNTLRRARPILHVKWFRKYQAPSAPASVDMIDIIDYSTDHPDWFTVLFQDGSSRKCTAGQIIMSAGHEFFNNKVHNLIAGRLAQAKISKRQLSNSSTDPNSSRNRAHNDHNHKNKSTNQSKKLNASKAQKLKDKIKLIKCSKRLKRPKYNNKSTYAQGSIKEQRQLVERDASKRRATRIII